VAVAAWEGGRASGRNADGVGVAAKNLIEATTSPLRTSSPARDSYSFGRSRLFAVHRCIEPLMRSGRSYAASRQQRRKFSTNVAAHHAQRQDKSLVRAGLRRHPKLPSPNAQLRASNGFGVLRLRTTADSLINWLKWNRFERLCREPL
jgi:hypothetical protein